MRCNRKPSLPSPPCHWLPLAQHLPAACLIALFTALGTTPAAAAHTLTVSMPVTQVPGSHQPDRPYDATLTLPAGSGRFPAVILLHGCGGESRSQQFWIDRLTGRGYAVLRLDGFSTRGITSVCAPQSQYLATAADRSGDVLSAALWLRTCQAFAAALAPDQPMQAVVYPGAVHDFDNPTAIRLNYVLGHPVQYDASAADDSYAKVKAFLARYLGGAA